MAILTLPTELVSIEAFGFDVDGVLRNTGYQAFVNCQLAIKELGGTPPKFEDFLHDWCGILTNYYHKCGVECSDEEIVRVNSKYVAMHDGIAPYDDVIETLTYLSRKRVRLFAVSGHDNRKLEQWFLNHELRTHFLHVFGSAHDKVDTLKSVCEQIGCMPAHTCYAGDWGQDMRAAKQVGLIPIGVTRELPSRTALERNGARLVIEHLSELIKRVQ